MYSANSIAPGHRAVTGAYPRALAAVGSMHISAGLERLILFLYPTFVVLLSAVLCRRRIGRVHGIALLLSYAGILLVYGSDPSADSPDGSSPP